jgi:hypothetical protein
LTLGTASPGITISETGRPSATNATSAQTVRHANKRIPKNSVFFNKRIKRPSAGSGQSI